MPRFIALLSAVFVWTAGLAHAETDLLMAEEDGCYWCGRWNDEIAHIYPKTEEGQAAPLERYDLYSQTPDVEMASRVRYTPTFILVKDGVEVGRIEGYPGEDFFWPLLSELIERAQSERPTAS